MTIDPVRDYINAKGALSQARTRVENVVRQVHSVAAKLDHWSTIVIAGGSAYPEHLIGGESISLDEWPSIQQLDQALSDYHRLCHEADNAWRRVPAADHASLQPPESK